MLFRTTLKTETESLCQDFTEIALSSGEDDQQKNILKKI